MKLLIASDLHGSAYNCRLLLEAFQREKADRLVLLGDLLYHGPRNPFPQEYDTKAVTAMLNGAADRLLCVRGNCDGEVDQMVLEFPILAEYCLLYLQKRQIFATHGHRYNLENLPPLPPGDILLHGPPHVPACREAQGVLYLNPGAVSMPKENSWRGYLLLTDEGVIWKTLEGEVKMTYDFTAGKML